MKQLGNMIFGLGLMFPAAFFVVHAIFALKTGQAFSVIMFYIICAWLVAMMSWSLIKLAMTKEKNGDRK